jgi:hypothetical protein
MLQRQVGVVRRPVRRRLIPRQAVPRRVVLQQAVLQQAVLQQAVLQQDAPQRLALLVVFARPGAVRPERPQPSSRAALPLWSSLRSASLCSWAR